jgi:2-polyprenyl-3-methyl-5-hydroxy-6-metoxy-1,4-benzoquinol methylase
LGHAREAIPRYEQAVAGHLPDGELEEATIDLGRSYRAAGEPAESAEILRRGLARFPENQALRTFLAMSLHDIGEYREAMTTLLRVLSESSSDPRILYCRRVMDKPTDGTDETGEVSSSVAAEAVAEGAFNALKERSEEPGARRETMRYAVRRELVIRALSEHLPSPPATVVDVGGGSGRIAVPLAKKGYEVTILDPSGETLRRAGEARGREDPETQRRVRLVQGRGEEAPLLLGEAEFDAATCHGVLPYLEDPEPLVRALAGLVRPGGLISVLSKNAESLAMRPALKGHYRKALGSMNVEHDEGPLAMITRADTVSGLQSIFESAGADFIGWYGVRVFTDHLGDAPETAGELEDAVDLEWEAGRRDPYRGVARWVHVLARRASG